MTGAAARLPVPTDEALKDPKTWQLADKRLSRLDTVEKTNGSLVYGSDLKLPGMLYAAIKACPVFGGKLESFDAAAVASRPGVKKVVQVSDNAVAVVGNQSGAGNVPAVLALAGSARKLEAVCSYPF